MASRYGRFYRYIAGEFLFSFMVSFLFFFFIFFVNQILLVAEEILSKSIPPNLVAKLLFYSLPSIISFALPFGALVGALMAIGRLSSDNEILAMQASGVPHRRIFVPLAVLGLVFSGGSFIINDIFLPLGTIKFGQLYREILYSNPELELSPFSIKRYQRSTIITGDIKDKVIHDILIIDRTPEKDQRIITAETAVLNKAEKQNGVISLNLDNVFVQTMDRQKINDYEYLESDSMIYNILLKDLSFSMKSPGPREMSSRDVKAEVDKKQKDLDLKIRKNLETAEMAAIMMQGEYNYRAASGDNTDYGTLENSFENYESRIDKKITDRVLKIYLVEYYKKFSLPFACFAFVLFAFPVGLFTKRSGRSVGFGIGLLVAVAYWGLLFAGQTFGIQDKYNSLFFMWMPNLVIMAAAGISALVRFRN